MAAARRRNGQAALLRMIILFTLGSAAISGITGYLIGTNRQIYTFTIDQAEFVDGVSAGSRFKADFDAWKAGNEESPDPNDFRADPRTRCAGNFYPKKRMAMEGCLQAIDGRPPDGYRIPTTG